MKWLIVTSWNSITGAWFYHFRNHQLTYKINGLLQSPRSLAWNSSCFMPICAFVDGLVDANIIWVPRGSWKWKASKLGLWIFGRGNAVLLQHKMAHRIAQVGTNWQWSPTHYSLSMGLVKFLWLSWLDIWQVNWGRKTERKVKGRWIEVENLRTIFGESK